MVSNNGTISEKECPILMVDTAMPCYNCNNSHHLAIRSRTIIHTDSPDVSAYSDIGIGTSRYDSATIYYLYTYTLAFGTSVNVLAL